jgi:two-component system cell cycle sensor histidine kinase/response regulator CckA
VTVLAPPSLSERAGSDADAGPPHLAPKERQEALQSADLEILELVATGAPLRQVLAALVRQAEQQSESMLGTILLVEGGVIHHACAPGLPAEFVRALDGQAIGDGRGSCGSAAYHRQPVIVEDIASDPLWADFREVALACGLRACWSVPILGSDDSVLGTFAFYYTEPRRPTARQLGLIARASHLASIAIERRRARDALIESEARARAIIENALDANITITSDGLVTGWNAMATRIFGWTAEQARGRLLADLIIPEAARERHRAGLARYLATRESRLLDRRVEVMALHRDGFEFPVELAITPISLGSGMMFSAFVADITERKRAVDALRESEQHLSLVYDHVDEVLFHLQVEGPGTYRFVSANPAFFRTTGMTPAQVIGKLLEEVIGASDLPEALVHHAEAIRTRQTVRWQERIAFPTGERIGDVVVTPVFDRYGQPKYLIGAVRDVTEARRMEDEMRQLQKLEALGRLTGGVAHDFNNMLSVISAYAESIHRGLHISDPMRGDVEEIAKASKRAAALTRQLLAFARKQTLEPKIIDLNRVVVDLQPMLGRLIREDVQLTTDLAPGLWPVTADPGQFEQVVINLAVNARDAMPDGGTLSVSTANLEHGGNDVHMRADLPRGEYVMVSVTDTGCGMDAETIKRVFDPFFTTKDAHQGVGLGLSTVYGIVKQSGGYIRVQSEPGRGTTFELFFARTIGEPVLESMRAPRTQPGAGGEHVLLVEDEPALRQMCERMLRSLHYRVTAFANGGEALLSVEEDGVQPDLLVTDLTMPGMSGKTLAQRLLRSLPHLRVLYMSGYTDNIIAQDGVLLPGTTFLAKPFAIGELEAKVQTALAGP